MTEFHAYGTMHFVTLACFVALTTLTITIGQRARKVGLEDRFRNLLGWTGLAFFVVHQIYWCMPDRLDPAESLPLHVCDINGLVAPLALLTRKRWLRTTLYFWGIGLSLQGLIQPVSSVTGPATSRFWFFFLSHAIIVGYAFYDLVVGRYRPTWRDLALILGISLAYFAVLIPLDIWQGWNYGYLGKTDDQPPFIKMLGAWPGRLVTLFAIGAAAFVGLWAPFAIRARLKSAAR